MDINEVDESIKFKTRLTLKYKSYKTPSLV